jgi:hypothetical protein
LLFAVVFDVFLYRIFEFFVLVGEEVAGILCKYIFVGLEDADVEELMDTFAYYPGDTEVVFVNNGQKMLCSERVNPGKALMAELASFLPANCIKLA